MFNKSAAIPAREESNLTAIVVIVLPCIEVPSGSIGIPVSSIRCVRFCMNCCAGVVVGVGVAVGNGVGVAVGNGVGVAVGNGVGVAVGVGVVVGVTDCEV